MIDLATLPNRSPALAVNDSLLAASEGWSHASDNPDHVQPSDVIVFDQDEIGLCHVNYTVLEISILGDRLGPS